MRVVDSLRNKISASPDKDKDPVDGKSPDDAETPVLELGPELIDMQPIENKLHYPDQMSGSEESDKKSGDLNPQDFDIPSFMRKKRLNS